MNGPDEQFDELRGLVARLREQQLTPADELRLKQILTDSAEARKAYAEYLALGALLELEVAAIFPDAKLAESLFVGPIRRMGPGASDDIASNEGPARQAGPTTSAPPKSPVLGFLGGVVDYVGHSRTLMFWLLCGCFGIYFAVQLGSVMVSRFWAQNAAQVASDRGAGTEMHGNAGDRPGFGTAEGKVVARLANVIDCQWKLSRPGGTDRIDQPEWVALDVGTELHAGQKLNLAVGLAELTFDSGAKVILHAPARFDVTDRLGGDLHVGKLTAKVPHTASGFTIATPGGKVVDLGTEFGVKVNDDGAMNVIVYVGDVQVESGSDGTGFGGTDQPKVVHVHAGQAVTVGPDHIAKPIPPENERFVRDLAPLGDKTKVESAYVEFMKSLKPIVWFRMEGKPDERVLHDEMGGKDAKLDWDGPGNPFVKSGKIGKGLWLRGAKLKDGAIVSDFPKAELSKFSVAAWAYAESLPANATIAKNWSTAVGRGQFHFGLEGGVLCAYISQADGQIVPAREGATHPFPLYEWQHVAFTTDGSITRLYRQGREIAAVKHSALFYPVNTRALGIGEEIDPAGAPSGLGYWDGKLDELAIFNDTLSAEAIQKLANSAPR